MVICGAVSQYYAMYVYVVLLSSVGVDYVLRKV